MRTVVRLSLIRKQTWLGGERRVVGSSILVAVLLGWMLINSYGWLPAVVSFSFFWGLGTWAGREMVKNDSYTLDVWVRHVRYRKYYPARAHFSAELPIVKDFI